MHTLPFRQAPIEEACTRCREPAVERCARCGAPLCSVHAPAASQRCADCEMIFYSKANRPSVTLVPLLTWLVGAPILGLISMWDEKLPFAIGLNLLLGTLFISPFITVGARAVYSFFTRRHFLRQRSLAAKLPISYCEESWFEVGESWGQTDEPSGIQGDPPFRWGQIPPWRRSALFLPRIQG